MPILKRIIGFIGILTFMILFLYFYKIENYDAYRNFLLIEAIGGTIIVLLIFNPSSRRVRCAFLAGVASAVSAFIFGAYGSYLGWYLMLGGKVRILGVPMEMISWVFFLGVMASIISEAPKLLIKLGGLFRKIFDKIEHFDKLSAFFVMFLLSGVGTFSDFISAINGALLTARYWTFAFSFCVWLTISFITLITYNYLKMPYEFALIQENIS